MNRMSHATRALAPAVAAGPSGPSTAVHLKVQGHAGRVLAERVRARSGRTYALCTEHVLPAMGCPRLDTGVGSSVPGLSFTGFQAAALAAREGMNR